MNSIKGVWLPIITPFYNGAIDWNSYKGLIEHYSSKGIAGIIPNGTTGECPVLDDSEVEELLARTVEYNSGRLPIIFGLGGNNTAKVQKMLKVVEKYRIDGILSVCPYYNRPDQEGIFEHFKAISESTTLSIVIYNIPYRTGRNIENETLFRLAELKNIVGVKDSCGSIAQTLELIANRPSGFSVLTGEDILFLTNLVHGGDGGIMASSHINTDTFVKVMQMVEANNHKGALEEWRSLERFIPLLFKEPNPAPLKYLLADQGLIKSDELRLPLRRISNGLKQELNKLFVKGVC